MIRVSLVVAAAVAAVSAATMTSGSAATKSSPIQHVLVVFQENHSFDDTLGKLCQLDRRCDGAITGTFPNGQQAPLTPEPDLVPVVDHSVSTQAKAVNGGKMDGFGRTGGCKLADGYACLAQYDPAAIPNLAALARSFALSDRTFSPVGAPSWGGHMLLAAATLDGFSGDNPTVSTYTQQTGPGWGCDSYRDANWWDATSGTYVSEPACVPDQQGRGPYRSSPVRYVPTIFDRLDAAGLPWRIYGGGPATRHADAYVWDICPTFYECLGSNQATHLVDAGQVVADAASGNLPAYGVVTPERANSQHNSYSMVQGDNWIGQVVGAAMNGPEWASTAVFVTYDDCGCFYDHVPPPNGWGVRVPMVVVSPFARPGFTDSTPTTFLAPLAYTEHLFGLAPLTAADATAYDLGGAFDYSQEPRPPAGMVRSTVPAWEIPLIRKRLKEPEDDT